MLLPNSGIQVFLWMDTPQNKFVPFWLILMEITVLIGVVIKVLSAIKLKITLDQHVTLIQNISDKVWTITDVTKTGVTKFVFVEHLEKLYQQL